MKSIIKPGITLMIYGLIAGLGLGYINSLTSPVIEAQEEVARMAAIEEVLPEAQVFDPDTVDSVQYITGYADSSEITPVGYIITAYGNGFSSTIKTVVGLNPDFTISAIEIVYQSETPGLGTKSVEITDGPEPWFEMQFDDKLYNNLAVDKDGGDIKSITGATITSRAITNSVKIAAKELKLALGENNDMVTIPGGPQCDPNNPDDPNCHPDSAEVEVQEDSLTSERGGE